MRDEFTPLESDPQKPGLDSIVGMRQPGDVDQMVFSFLSELNSLSDALESTIKKHSEDNERALPAVNRPEPVGVQPAASKPASYRNIDVLLMDNRQFQAGKESAREESSSTSHGLFESRFFANSAEIRRRRVQMRVRSIASIALLVALGILFYLEPGHLAKRGEIADLLRTASSPAESVPVSARPKGDAPALTPGILSPAVAIEKVLPWYPEEARRSGVTGTVELDAEVDAQGKVMRAVAVSGPSQLREAAADSVLKWRFKPAQRDGINCGSTARVSVVFKP